MKFQAQWFLDGKEAELPEMKIEGSMAVAELMKKHVDEFLPFVLAMQEEATLRLRVTVLSTIIEAKEASEEQLAQLKTLCTIYGVLFDKEKLPETISLLLAKATGELVDSAQKVAKVQITSAPFFLERSLIEAYFMLKAYLFEVARKSGKQPSINFTIEDLKTMITDDELSAFARNSLARMKAVTGGEPSLEKPDEEEIKKKLLNGHGKSE
jgi:hypothetical protein